MRSALLAVITSGVLSLAGVLLGTGGCGGQEPVAQPPPAGAPAPVPPAPPLGASAAPAPADTTPPPPAKPSLAEIIPRTLQGMRDAFNAHDAKKLASFCTETCTVAGYGQPDCHG